MKFVILLAVFCVAGAWSLSIKPLVTFADDSNWQEVEELLDSLKKTQRRAKDTTLIQLEDLRAEITSFAHKENSQARLLIDEETSILSEQIEALETLAGRNAKKLQCTLGLRDTIAGVINTVKNYTLDCIHESVTECVQTINSIKLKISESDVKVHQLDIETNKCKSSIQYPNCLAEIKGELIAAYVEIPSTILEESLRALTLVNTWTTSITACITSHSGQVTTIGEPVISNARNCISNVY